MAANEIIQALGSAKSRALPMFHSFTGCDTVTAFAGKRNKKTCFGGLENISEDNRVIQ